MKKIFSILFVTASLVAAAQPKKAPKMAPLLEPGYYVTGKNDTVRGEVQTNPEDPTELYRQFYFKPANGGKVMPVSPKKAKAYGYGNRHFVQVVNEEGEVYIDRLAAGRLNFFEYKFNGKIDGNPGIESFYYMQDTRGEGADAALKDIKKISNKFYKRDLKPYMKDQLMIWTDLDKFTFDKNGVTKAIVEFNKFYAVTAD